MCRCCTHHGAGLEGACLFWTGEGIVQGPVLSSFEEVSPNPYLGCYRQSRLGVYMHQVLAIDGLYDLCWWFQPW